jgi:DNA-binding PadR family transcriptional regulator
MTKRTREALEAIGATPRLSNRKVAEALGGVDAGQMSKLLHRLEDLGLIANAHHGRQRAAGANSWSLTATGRRAIARTAASPRTSRR